MTRNPILTAAEGLAGMVAAVALLIAVVPFSVVYAAGILGQAIVRRKR